MISNLFNVLNYFIHKIDHINNYVLEVQQTQSQHTVYKETSYGITFEAEDPICKSKLYCPGIILDTIQKSGILSDNKEFLDRPTRLPSSDVIKNFHDTFPEPKYGYKDKGKVESFLVENFHPKGYDTEINVILPDFNYKPQFISNIPDSKLQDWSYNVNLLWFNLSRKSNPKKICDQCETTLIHSDNTFIVPGGRFIEYYYWDSYFVIKGLLISGMSKTAKGMILNFISLVSRFGFIPNGSRTYYLNRSQPPLLIKMVEAYYEFTNDLEFVQEHLPVLEKEYQYWMTGKKRVSVRCPPSIRDGQPCYLNRYFVETEYPRPESWIIDYNVIQHHNLTKYEQSSHYSELETGAETGWDYSYRWIDNSKNDETLRNPNFVVPKETEDESLFNLQVRDILPTDLDSIIYNNERQLSRFHLLLADSESSIKYAKLADRRAQLLEHYHYNEQYSEFLDYNLKTNSSQLLFAPSNYFPYWTKALTPSHRNNTKKLLRSFDWLIEIKAHYKGGIPTSLYKSGLQWDFPNSWPPLEYVLIEGIDNVVQELKEHKLDGDVQKEKLQKLINLRDGISQTYIDSLYCGWTNTGGFQNSNSSKPPSLIDGQRGIIFEKYSALNLGSYGIGGEYPVQFGFGWSNGVLFHLLHKYGTILKAPDLQICAIKS